MKTKLLILSKNLTIAFYLFSMIIGKRILTWYKSNKRDLPWRETKDPYLIWVSEIIMQQTQIIQGQPYYKRFINSFPNVHALANANETEVLQLWQGLGYYSRARNMHFTAKIIVKDFAGIFPDSYSELLKLKGVGKYTAAAIASICFNESVAAIDGNVQRVFARVFDIKEPINKAAGQKIIETLGEQELTKNEPGNYNQAMMDFGATVCIPRNPKCDICPISLKCLALKNSTIEKRPVKIKNTKIKKRYFNYILIQDNKHLYLSKRTKQDIWKNLYEFPNHESDAELTPQEITETILFNKLINNQDYHIEEIWKSKIHKLSHQHINAIFYKVRICKLIPLDDFIVIKTSELSEYPLPQLIVNFLNRKSNNQPD